MATVLEAIMAFLLPQDILNLSSTCKLFYQLTQSDQVWAAACYQKFGIKIHSVRGFAKNFYKNGNDKIYNGINNVEEVIV